MMIGDSLEYDVEGANSAGIKGILLDRTNKYPNCQAPKICSLLDLLDQEGRIACRPKLSGYLFSVGHKSDRGATE